MITGYSLDELRKKTIFEITHPADIARDREFFEEQWSGVRAGYTIEKRYLRKDGGVIWVELAASQVRTGDGADAYGVRILRDITDRKNAEEQQRLLLGELNHRVKNTLTVVQSIAHQTFKNGSVAPDLLRSFEGRLTALAAAHNVLIKQTWEATPISMLWKQPLRLSKLWTAHFRCWPEVLLTSSATVTLTLALHELATNAAKYGALSNDIGKVEIAWTVKGEKLIITWREREGPAVAEPTRSGFGTRLLERGVARDLGGSVTIDFRPIGLTCTITAPLIALVP